MALKFKTTTTDTKTINSDRSGGVRFKSNVPETYQQETTVQPIEIKQPESRLDEFGLPKSTLSTYKEGGIKEEDYLKQQRAEEYKQKPLLKKVTGLFNVKDLISGISGLIKKKIDTNKPEAIQLMDQHFNAMADYYTEQLSQPGGATGKSAQEIEKIIKDDLGSLDKGVVGIVAHTFLPTRMITEHPQQRFKNAVIKQELNNYAENNPIPAVIGGMIGGALNLILFKNLGAGFGLTEKVSKLATGTRNMYPTLTRIAGFSSEWGSIFGLESMAEEVFNEIQSGKIEPTKIATEGVKGAATGTVTGAGFAMPKLLGRTLVVGSVNGGLTTIQKLIEDGKINSKDLVDIAISTGVGALLALSTGSKTSKIYRGQELETMQKDMIVGRIRSNNPNLTQAEAEQVAILMEDLPRAAISQLSKNQQTKIKTELQKISEQIKGKTPQQQKVIFNKIVDNIKAGNSIITPTIEFTENILKNYEQAKTEVATQKGQNDPVVIKNLIDAQTQLQNYQEANKENVLTVIRPETQDNYAEISVVEMNDNKWGYAYNVNTDSNSVASNFMSNDFVGSRQEAIKKAKQDVISWAKSQLTGADENIKNQLDTIIDKIAQAEPSQQQTLNTEQQQKTKIPTTKLSGLGFMEVEVPVAKAVEATAKENSMSSGFHTALNQRWTIVYKNPSKKLISAAEQAGLEVSTRETPKGSGQMLTDVSLPNVSINDQTQATRVFNDFADIYSGERPTSDIQNVINKILSTQGHQNVGVVDDFITENDLLNKLPKARKVKVVVVDVKSPDYNAALFSPKGKIKSFPTELGTEQGGKATLIPETIISTNELAILINKRWIEAVNNDKNKNVIVQFKKTILHEAEHAERIMRGEKYEYDKPYQDRSQEKYAEEAENIETGTYEKGDTLRSETVSIGGETNDAGQWKIVTNTEKTISLELINKPKMIWGEVADINDEVGKTLIIKKDNSGQHVIKDWSDGSFTVYPNRSGIPIYFEKETKTTKPTVDKFTGKEIQQVAIADIIPEERGKVKQETIDQVVADKEIKRPVLLRKQGDKYLIVDGANRVEAAKQLGLTEVPAVLETIDTEPKPRFAKKEPTAKLPQTSRKAEQLDEKQSVEVATKVMPKKPAIPALGTFLVKDGIMSATDLEIGLKLKTELKDGIYTAVGKEAVPAKDISADDFPIVPEAKGEPMFKLISDDFRKVIKRSIDFIDKKNMRNEITGTYVVSDGRNIIIRATDAYTLFKKTLPAKVSEAGKFIFIPQKMEKVINYVGALTEATLDKDKQFVKFAGDNGEVVVRTIEGDFPDTSNVYPAFTKQYLFERKDLLNAIKELKPFYNKQLVDKKSVEVVYDTKNRKLNITTTNEIEGKRKTISVSATEKDVDIPEGLENDGAVVMPLMPEGNKLWLDPNYIERALGVLDEDATFMYLTKDPKRPALFTELNEKEISPDTQIKSQPRFAKIKSTEIKQQPVGEIATEKTGKEFADEVDKFIGEVSPPPLGLSLKEVKEPRFGGNKVAQEQEKFTFENSEIEARYQRSKGLQNKKNLFVSIQQHITDIYHSLTREHKGLPRLGEYAQLQRWLRTYLATKEVTNDKAARILQGITIGLNSNQFDLFSRKVLLNDLAQEAKTGHKLPFGFNHSEVISELGRVDAKLDEATTNAIDKRNKFIEALQKDLVKYDILSEDQLKEDYFHHQVIQYAIERPRIMGTGTRLRQTRHGYAKQRGGSEMDINADYLQAEFEVIAQGLLDIETAKTVREIENSKYNIRPRISQKLSAINRAVKDKTIDDKMAQQILDQTQIKNPTSSDQRAINNAINLMVEDAKRGALSDKWEDYVPSDWTTWQPREGNVFYHATSLPEKIMLQLQNDLMREANITKEDLKTITALGGKRKQFVLSENVADALSNLRNFKERGAFNNVFREITRSWKAWVLFNPRRAIKYNLQNMAGDFDALIAGNPGALKYVNQAIKELYEVFYGKKSMTENMRDFFERGGLSSNLTIQEVPDISTLKIFEELFDKSQKENLWQKIGAKSLFNYFNAVKDFSSFRENWFRYAAYLDYINKLNNNQPTGYGASIPEEIDAIENDKDKAAKLATELLGDYQAISQAGKEIRDTIIPFYSWLEINFRRYTRLFKNVFKSNGAGGVPGLAGRLALGAGTKLGVRLGFLMLRMAALWLAFQIWNKTFFGDEERELSDYDRARMHLNLGRNKNGEVKILRVQGAFGDFLQWFGMDDFITEIQQLNDGQISWGDILENKAKAPVNKLVQAITPLYKMPMEMLTKRSFFPDTFNPSIVRDPARNIAKSLSLENEYDLLLNKPSRGYLRSWTQSVITSFDPDETAYYDIVALKYDFMEKNLGISGSSDFTSPRSEAYREYKQALRFKDKEAEENAVEKMRKLGIEYSDLQRSLNAADPLSGLSNENEDKFIDWLNGFQKEKLKRAQKYYEETFQDADQPEL